MGFAEDIRTIADINRRLESYRLQYEAQIAKLKAENSRLAEEVKRLQERREPGSRKIAEECKTCLFRVETLKRMAEGAKMKME
jgi:cell division protein FtsB